MLKLIKYLVQMYSIRDGFYMVMKNFFFFFTVFTFKAITHFSEVSVIIIFNICFYLSM